MFLKALSTELKLTLVGSEQVTVMMAVTMMTVVTLSHVLL